MATKARFLKAADNARPHKSHRYDLFGLKIERQLTLFGRRPLEAWIALEAEPSVVSYCERPLLIPDSSSKRVVDFWVRYRDREELWLLERATDGSEKQREVLAAFALSNAAAAMSIRYVPEVRDDKLMYVANWGRIIRELSANRRFVSRNLTSLVKSHLSSPTSLGDLIDFFPAEDPVLVRSAAFALLHVGEAFCSDIDKQPIGMSSLLEAV